MGNHHHPHSLTDQRVEILCEMKRRVLDFRTLFKNRYNIPPQQPDVVVDRLQNRRGDLVADAHSTCNSFLFWIVKKLLFASKIERKEGAKDGEWDEFHVHRISSGSSRPRLILLGFFFVYKTIVILAHFRLTSVSIALDDPRPVRGDGHVVRDVPPQSGMSAILHCLWWNKNFDSCSAQVWKLFSLIAVSELQKKASSFSDWGVNRRSRAEARALHNHRLLEPPTWSLSVAILWPHGDGASNGWRRRAAREGDDGWTCSCNDDNDSVIWGALISFSQCCTI